MQFFPAHASAANQTASLSPIDIYPNLPYRLEVRPVTFGAGDLPTLHSYAVGNYGGKWLFVSGRTSGLHGFNSAAPDQNFPPQLQNREVWVIDIANKQSWHRSLEDASSGLTAAQVTSLATTNNQFYQSGDMLYMTGGYGADELGNYQTFDTLSAIDLAGLGAWVTSGVGSAADHIRQIHDPLFKVTGGAMYDIEGRTHLVFGQDFDGIYRPSSNGDYTQQVRSFDILDDGTHLSIANVYSSRPDAAYRRRDLNVFPTIRANGAGLEPGLAVLSGVFTLTFGAWTVPVEIDAAGDPAMADPTAEGTFKQGMNNYHSAKVGFYSEAAGEMHEILFGGISLQYFDATSSSIVTDHALPFVNDITSVKIDAAGNYSQSYLGQFPELFDIAGNRLRFGANAEFLLADGIPTFENDVIKLDALHGETVLGHIYGGIVANAPHTQASTTTLSAASNRIFEVLLMPTLSGDYNFDGAVDAADYVAWRKTDVTPPGYDTWRTHFGEILASGSGTNPAAIVPEPGLVMLTLLMTVLGGPTRRRSFT
jgi:hypothetical protein